MHHTTGLTSYIRPLTLRSTLVRCTIKCNQL